jgi:hypothetical protein
VIDRDKVINLATEHGEMHGDPWLWTFTEDGLASFAATLLREFGHVADCRCHVCDGPHCAYTAGEHPWRDPRCFQQSPAKETDRYDCPIHGEGDGRDCPRC